MLAPSKYIIYIVGVGIFCRPEKEIATGVARLRNDKKARLIF